jgi:hypothetical protein
VNVNGSVPVIEPPLALAGPTLDTVTDGESFAVSVAPANVTGMPAVLPSESVTARGHGSFAGSGWK